ncbi:hypothetical protein Htur_1176 [Haloterrigena turkmenica DSM 5511]|uniref:DUF7344 domain-containing protein n=1 Tax=Haloterrigena turkmenica (strain ATCC 51198 / DSM 5511 / JCM 9101 / NCIMB 13204 / VKM B-1734 / 4k) TaxID=543526 RepID=D2RZE4_HALTV|nr:hypothetical protein [Haloterrigena turkmenica]ADB60068.1 hypothetical protein Htur_1176 [Haloterrigena turkmenica DSM 5511]
MESSGNSRSDEPRELSQDEIFHILQTNRRRDVIAYLLDRAETDPVKMRDIAELVAAKENETTVENLTSTQRQRVYIPLYQSHLPKLDEEGIIEYDKPRGIVRPSDRLEIFRPYLDATNATASDDRSTDDTSRGSVARSNSEYYVGAIGASVGLLAASASGLLPISGLLLAAITVALFGLAHVAATLAVPHSSDDADDSRPLY